uniref:Tpr repeat-containing protein n=1 Tax=Tetraselmis sp. GSL018 TaxID=582737 RepID=A0A061SFL4_9CHLO
MVVTKPGMNEELASKNNQELAPALFPLAQHASDRGVPVQWFLEEFIPQVRERLGENFEEATTKMVVEEVVKVNTASNRRAYVQLIPCSRPPDFFISHTWHRPFSELFCCLSQHFRDLQGSAVWVDIFAFNQHLSFQEMETDLSTLAQTVRQTQKTLVVMDPQGLCFTRAWCLKEHNEAVILGGGGSHGNPGKLQIMPYCLLRNGMENVVPMMYNIQVENSTATVAADKEMILQEIRNQEGGIEQFNTVLKRALRMAVAAMPQLLSHDNEARRKMLSSAAVLFMKAGDYQPSQQLYEEALQESIAALGEQSAETLHVVQALAVLHRKKAEYVTSERYQLQALEGFRQVLGGEHSDTLHAVHTLGLLRMDQGQHEVAEQLLLQGLEGRIRTVGEDHPSTLTSLNSLANFYRGV